MKKKDKKRPDFSSTQNDNELFSDVDFHSDGKYDLPRYPERKNIELPTENDDAEYAFDWEPVSIDEEPTPKKEKEKKHSSLSHTFIMAGAFVLTFGFYARHLLHRKRITQSCPRRV